MTTESDRYQWETSSREGVRRMLKNQYVRLSMVAVTLATTVVVLGAPFKWLRSL